MTISNSVNTHFHGREIILEWLSCLNDDFINVINDEIAEITATLNNEKIIELGCESADEAAIHAKNIETYVKYLGILEKLRNKQESESYEEVLSDL